MNGPARPGERLKCQCGVFLECEGQSRYDELTGRCWGYSDSDLEVDRG